MRRFRIRISDPEDQERGIYEVMLRGQVICLRDDQFIVPEPALKVLDDLKVGYELMGEEGTDGVIRSLRDPAATSV